MDNNRPTDEAIAQENEDVVALASKVISMTMESGAKSALCPLAEAMLQVGTLPTTQNGLSTSPPEEGDVDDDETPEPPKYAALQEINSSNIVIERSNKSPSKGALVSAKTWEDLNLPEDLLKGIYARNFVHPSRIQGLALPLVLTSTENLVAQAQNGSGKTATFALCMLAKTNRNNINPQSLCLCHTRELARQNMDVIRDLGKFTGVTAWLAVPQGEYYDERAGAQIVVGTPGKVRELLMKRKLPVKDVHLFILDEADVMMDHVSNMGATVAQIRQSLPKDIQILLFSATYPDRVKSFVLVHIPRANRLEVRKEDLTLSAISQFYIECTDDSEKFNILSDLYGCMTVGQSVIFVNTRKLGFSLAQRMKAEGHAVSLICGTMGGPSGGSDTMDHETRERVMAEFRNGETKVLIATDLLARGIDVPQVTLVINYHMPMRYGESNAVDQETYIHRIGRTGRFGLKGLAITLILKEQLELVKQIENFYRCQINPLSKDPEQIEEMVRQLRQ